MVSDKTITGVSQFLQTYRADFQRYDAEAVIGHYLFPGHIVSDADTVALMPLAIEADLRAGVERILDWHRRLGVVSSRLMRSDVIELSPRLASLDLEVELHGADGPLYDYRGFYTLVLRDGAWRIAALTHNQVPRLLACLSAHEGAAA